MGSLWLRHDGINLTVEWPGGALDASQFARTINALLTTYEAVSGTLARNVPASALTYDTGEASA
jgi:hypothetical protein